MSLVLRGHHLLCIHGFQGMGYNPDFVKKMATIVDRIRDEENDFPIKVVTGFDDACQVCPNRGESKCEASFNDHVFLMDRKVIAQLGLIEGAVYSKSHLLELTAKEIAPDDLDYLCSNCSWLKYGVCKEGIANLKKSPTDKKGFHNTGEKNKL